MRVPDRCLSDLHDRGFLVFEGFLDAEELTAAQQALWLHYPRWTGRVAWAERGTQRDWCEIVERATPRERSVFGWPAPGDPYWDE